MPELVPFSQWETTESDPLARLQGYTNYVRGEHFKEGTLDLFTEQDIQQGFQQAAVQHGLITDQSTEEEAQAVLNSAYTVEDDPRSNLKFLQDYYDSNDDEERAGAVRSLMAAQKVGATEERMESLQADVDAFATKENIRLARMAAVDRGELPFVALTEEDGTRTIYPGANVTTDDLGVLYDQLTQRGAVKGSDLTQLSLMMAKEPGTDAPAYVVQRQRQFGGTLEGILEENPEINSMLSMIIAGEEEAHNFQNKGMLGKFFQRTGQVASGSMHAVMKGAYATGGLLAGAAMGVEDPVGEASQMLGSMDSGLRRWDSSTGEAVIDALSETALGAKYSREEISDFMNDIIKSAMRPGFDADNPERNFLKLSTGKLVPHQSLLANPALHDAQVDALEISDAQKQHLKTERRFQLEAQAPQLRKQIIKTFGGDALDQWEAIQANGGSDADFAEIFLSNEENYGKFSNRAKSFGMSVVDAVGGLMASAANLAGEATSGIGFLTGWEGMELAGNSLTEESAKALVALQRGRAIWKERASLFGDEFGFGQDVMEAIPQVAVDVAASYGIGRGLRAASIPVKSAAKWSLQTTAKIGVASRMSTATKAMFSDSIKGGATKASSVIKSFADDLLFESLPIAIPAFTRSMGASYASIYSQLPEEWSHAEKHKHAMGYAMTSGLATAAITLTFGKLGAGGVERLVMRGFSFRQMKTLYDDVLNAGRKSTDKAFKNAVARSYASAVRHLRGEALKHPVGEAMEEGLDEYVQGFIENAALNKDYSLTEVHERFWNAAMIGGVLGSAGSLKTYGFSSNIKRTPLSERAAARSRFMADIANNLQKSGSPATAATVRRMVDEANGRQRTARQEEKAREAKAEKRVYEEPNGQFAWNLGDPRQGSRIGEFPAGEQQAEFDLGDPRRTPDSDPAQLEFDFNNPPPNLDEAGEPVLPGFGDAAQPTLPGFGEPDQAEFDFKPDTDPRMTTPEEATEPFLPTIPKMDETDAPYFPGMGSPNPVPDTLRSMLGRHAYYNGYAGTVTYDPDTGEVVLALDHALPDGTAEVVLPGNLNSPPTGLSFHNRLQTLKAEENGVPAGTPFFKFGNKRFALQAVPDVTVLENENGDMVGVVIRNSKNIDTGGRADVTIRTPDKALEILRAYNISLNSLPRAADPSLDTVQEELNLNPDADVTPQLEERIPDEVKAEMAAMFDLLDADMEVNGQNYNLLDVMRLFESDNLHDQNYLDELAAIPMEVYDAIGTTLSAALDSIQNTTPSPETRALTETLIDQIARYESRESAYLAELERRATGAIRSDANRTLESQPVAPAPTAPEPAPAKGTSDDALPAQSPQAEPSTSKDTLLELAIDAVPTTYPVTGIHGEQTTLVDLEAMAMAARLRAGDPTLTEGEKRASQAVLDRVNKALIKARAEVEAQVRELQAARTVVQQHTEAPTEVDFKDEEQEEADTEAKRITEADPDLDPEPKEASLRMPAVNETVTIEHPEAGKMEVVVSSVDPENKTFTYYDPTTDTDVEVTLTKMENPDVVLGEMMPGQLPKTKPFLIPKTPKVDVEELRNRRTALTEEYEAVKKQIKDTPVGMRADLNRRRRELESEIASIDKQIRLQTGNVEEEVPWTPLSDEDVAKRPQRNVRESIEELYRVARRYVPEPTEREDKALKSIKKTLTKKTGKKSKRLFRLKDTDLMFLSPEVGTLAAAAARNGFDIQQEYDALKRRLKAPRQFQEDPKKAREKQQRAALENAPTIAAVLEYGKIQSRELYIHRKEVGGGEFNEKGELILKDQGREEDVEAQMYGHAYDELMAVIPAWLKRQMFALPPKKGQQAGKASGVDEVGLGKPDEVWMKITDEINNWKENVEVGGTELDYEEQMSKVEEFWENASKATHTLLRTEDLMRGDRFAVNYGKGRDVWFVVTKVNMNPETGEMDSIFIEDGEIDPRTGLVVNSKVNNDQRIGQITIGPMEEIYITGEKAIDYDEKDAFRREAAEERPVFDDEGNVVAMEPGVGEGGREIGWTRPPTPEETFDVKLTKEESELLREVAPAITGEEQTVALTFTQGATAATELTRAAIEATDPATKTRLEAKAKELRQLAPQREQAGLFGEDAEFAPKPDLPPAEKSKISQAADRARARRRERKQQGRLLTGIDPADLADMIIIGADYIVKGIRDFKKWSAYMIWEGRKKFIPDKVLKANMKRMWQDARVKSGVYAPRPEAVREIRELMEGKGAAGALDEATVIEAKAALEHKLDNEQLSPEEKAETEQQLLGVYDEMSAINKNKRKRETEARKLGQATMDFADDVRGFKPKVIEKGRGKAEVTVGKKTTHVVWDEVNKTWRDAASGKALGAKPNDAVVVLQQEALFEIEESLAPTPANFGRDEFRTEQERQMHKDLEKQGYMVRSLHDPVFGFDQTGKGGQTYVTNKADELEDKVFERYPLIPPPKTYANTGQRVKSKVQRRVSTHRLGNFDIKTDNSKIRTTLWIPVKRAGGKPDGKVISAHFTNHPVLTAEALKKGFMVRIPPKVLKSHNNPDSAFEINPTIKFHPSGEVYAVDLDPRKDWVAIGNVDNVTTPFELRSMATNADISNVLREPREDYKQEDYRKLEELERDFFSETWDGGPMFPGRHDKALVGIAKGITPDSLAELKYAVYLETKVRMQEAVIAKHIIAAMEKTNRLRNLRRQETEADEYYYETGEELPDLAATLDLVDMPNIILQHLRDPAMLDALVARVSKRYGIKGVKGHTASPEFVLNYYGKELVKDFLRGPRFPRGRIPVPEVIAGIFAKSFISKEMGRKVRHEDIMPTSPDEAAIMGKVVGEQQHPVSDLGETAQVISGYEQFERIETEADLIAHNARLRELLVDAIDSRDAVRNAFEDMLRRAGFDETVDLTAAEVLDALSAYSLTVEFDQNARVFMATLSKTNAGKRAAYLLSNLGILPNLELSAYKLTKEEKENIDATILDLERELSVAERKSAVRQMIDRREANRRLMDETKKVYDSRAVLRGAKLKAARARNKADLAALGLESGSPASVLRALRTLRTEGDPDQAALARLLMVAGDHLADIDIKIIDVPSLEFAGRFRPAENRVTINLAHSNGRGLTDVLLHEYLHAVTFRMITDPKTARERAAVQRMTKLREEILARFQRSEWVNDPHFLKDYSAALMDNVEFLAHALTNPRFQAAMKDISPGMSMLRKLVNAIINFFTLNRAGKQFTTMENAVEKLLDFTEMAADANTFGGNPDLDTARKFRQARERYAPIAQIQREFYARPEELLTATVKTIEVGNPMIAFTIAVDYARKNPATAAIQFKSANANSDGLHSAAVNDTINALNAGVPFENALFDFMDTIGALHIGNPGEVIAYDPIVHNDMDGGLLPGDPVRVVNEGYMLDNTMVVKTDVQAMPEGTPIPDETQEDTTPDVPSHADPEMEPRSVAEAREPFTLESAMDDRGEANPDNAPFNIHNFVQATVPPGFEVRIDEDGPGIYVAEDMPGVVFINPYRLAHDINGMSVLNAQSLIQSRVNEEVAHDAAFTALTPEEIQAWQDKQTDADWDKILEDYSQSVPEEGRPAFVRGWRKRLEDNPDEAKRKLTYEHFRRLLQKATRGFTTEEDAVYFRKDPGDWAALWRYLVGAFRRLFKLNGAKYDGQTAAMVNRMARELRYLKNGGRFFDITASITDGNFEENMEALGLTLESATAEVTDEDDHRAQFDRILTIFDIPVALAKGDGAYDAGKNWFHRAVRHAGDLDPRLAEINDVRLQAARLIESRVTHHNKVLNKLLKKHYGKREGAPDDIIRTAFGYSGSLLTQRDYDDANAVYDGELKSIDAKRDSVLEETKPLREEGNLKEALKIEKKMWKERKAQIDQAKVKAEKLLDERSIAAAEAHKQAAADALTKLPEDLAEAISNMRYEMDAFSEKVKKLDGNMSAEMKAIFDRNKGIYITRSYRIFTEEGFAKKMKEDPEFKAVRDNALKLFEDQLVRQHTETIMEENPGVTRGVAKQMAVEKVAKEGLAQKELEEFLARYDGDPRGFVHGDKNFKLDITRFMHKGDLPAELRELMGEETDPFKNAFRTYSNVAFLASNQFFINEFVRVGRKAGFLATKEEVEADPGKYSGFRTVKPESAKAYKPLAGLYAPPELLKGMEAMFSASKVTENTTSQKVMDKVFEYSARATGWSLGMKTLGSVGFFIRNFLSNVIFFGLMQGKVTLGRGNVLWKTIKGDTDLYMDRLVSLGVIGDDVRSAVLADLLRGQANDPAAVQKELDSKINTLMDKVGTVRKVNNATLGALYDKLQNLSRGIDAMHKVALFEHELSFLTEAYPDKPQAELEQLAAKKVKLTHQSYSQAIPVVREFSRSGFGLLVAPFARFKGEVFRTAFNSIKLGLEELKSDSAVIRKRGRQRMAGMGVLSMISTVVPMVLWKALGFGDEEDEAFRSGLPDYAKYNTFYHFPWFNGESAYFDATYINPWAIVADPIMRSFESIARGDIDEVTKIAGTTIFQTFFGEQIAMGAVADLTRNFDEQSGRNIYNPADEFGERMGDIIGYGLVKAYEPRLFTKARESYQKLGVVEVKEGEDAVGWEGAAWHMLSEFAPAKLRKLDAKRLANSYARSAKKEYDLIRTELGILRSRQPMTEEQVKDLYNANVEKRVRHFNKMRRIQRGFAGLGVDEKAFAREMISMRYSKDRMWNVLRNGVLDRPISNKSTLQVMRDNAPEGAARVRALFEATRETNRWLKLD